MLTDDRFLTSLKFLERARDDFLAGWKYYSQTLRDSLPEVGFPGTGESPVRTAEGQAGLNFKEWPPYLEELLEQTGSLSPSSLIVGVCDDGLPFLLDLTNPAPGSILIGAENGSGKTRLLRAILTSAVHLNPSEQVIYYLLSDQMDQLVPLDENNHCQGMLGSEETEVETLIDKLAMIAEARHRQRPRDPAIILAIDNLSALVDSLDNRTFTRLYWLIKHGPRAFIWTLATLPAESADRIHPRLLSAFRTRVIGRIGKPHLTHLLAGDDSINTSTLERGFQFCIPYGDEWLRFWLCESAPEGINLTDDFPEEQDLGVNSADDDASADETFEDGDLYDDGPVSHESEQEEMR